MSEPDNIEIDREGMYRIVARLRFDEDSMTDFKRVHWLKRLWWRIIRKPNTLFVSNIIVVENREKDATNDGYWYNKGHTILCWQCNPKGTLTKSLDGFCSNECREKYAKTHKEVPDAKETIS